VPYQSLAQSTTEHRKLLNIAVEKKGSTIFSRFALKLKNPTEKNQNHTIPNALDMFTLSSMEHVMNTKLE